MRSKNYEQNYHHDHRDDHHDFIENDNDYQSWVPETGGRSIMMIIIITVMIIAMKIIAMNDHRSWVLGTDGLSTRMEPELQAAKSTSGFQGGHHHGHVAHCSACFSVGWGS